MEFRHIAGSPFEAKADLIAIAVPGDPKSDAGVRAADRALGGVLLPMADEERFAGKAGQTLVAPTYGDLTASRVALIGVGPKGEHSLSDLRDFAARAVKLGRSKGARTVCLVAPHVAARDADAALGFCVEGAALGGYLFDRYRTGNNNNGGAPVKTVLVSTDVAGKRKPTTASRAALKRAVAIAEATCMARDMVNEPAIAMTPDRIAELARGLARKHSSVKCKVLNRAECEKLGMGLYLAVARGSAVDPRVVHLTYTPPNKKTKSGKRIAFIGKGVTFDSGGYSLKPSASMEDMKIDMAGSAAVISAMGAIAEIGSPHEVHVVAACCENMVSGGAYKLGDVFTALDGTTVEINNTDAEGRLTLGDAIGYTKTKIKPDMMFDFATLTGACMVALGPHTAGVLTNNEGLVKDWLATAEEAGESMWRLPLQQRLKEQLKSAIADMRNTGERWGGAITAGLFLSHFAGDTPWVHVDLAGPASASAEHGAVARGGTGFAVATIVGFATK